MLPNKTSFPRLCYTTTIITLNVQVRNSLHCVPKTSTFSTDLHDFWYAEKKFHIHNFHRVHHTWKLLPCEMQFLFIWLKLQCFLQKVNAPYMTSRSVIEKVKFQTRNIAEIVKCTVLVLTCASSYFHHQSIQSHHPLCSTEIQLSMNLLTVGYNVCARDD